MKKENVGEELAFKILNSEFGKYIRMVERYNKKLGINQYGYDWNELTWKKQDEINLAKLINALFSKYVEEYGMSEEDAIHDVYYSDSVEDLVTVILLHAVERFEDEQKWK